jgi:hypothetical protein
MCVVGEDVEFDIEANPQDDSKKVAKNVTGPNGAEVLGSIRQHQSAPAGDFNGRDRNRY